MDPDERTYIRSGDRVIDVAPPDFDLADWCLAQGASYLALVPPHQIAAMSQTAGATRAHLVAPLNSIDEISVNNADVVVLHHPYRRLVWQRHLGNARIVATRARGATGMETVVATRLVRRKLTTTATWGSHRYRTIAQPVYRHTSARHYLSPALGVAGLPERLDEHGVAYAVLRWFDTLPHVEPGEDLDMLVADDDLPALLDVLESAPGTIACDIYSTTGLPRADYNGMAYYPPRLAAEVLATSERHSSGYRVPSPRTHFRSLAYHALYHKGHRAGLPSATDEVTAWEQPEHDYAAALATLAPHDDYTGAITMEALDDHLASVGWRPSRDNLARLAEHNEWLRARHFPAQLAAESGGATDDGATAVFVLRQRAAEHGVPIAERALGEHGFEVLGVHPLDDDARQRCAHDMRGGNWGPGPYPASGGDPAVAIVALDRHPRRPTPAQVERYPGLTNANIFTAKLAVRDAILADVPDDAHYNPVHSSDSELDAWEYVDMAMPTDAERMRELVAARRHEVAPPLPPAHDADVDTPAPSTPAPPTPARGERVRRAALWLPRRIRAFLAYRLARWRLAGLTDAATSN